MSKYDQCTALTSSSNLQKTKIHFFSSKQHKNGTKNWLQLEQSQTQAHERDKSRVSKLINNPYQQLKQKKQSRQRHIAEESVSVRPDGNSSRLFFRTGSLGVSKKNRSDILRCNGQPAFKSTQNFGRAKRLSHLYRGGNGQSCSSSGRRSEETMSTNHKRLCRVFQKLREVYVLNHEVAKHKTATGSQIITYPIASKPMQDTKLGNIKAQLPFVSTVFGAKKRSNSHEPIRSGPNYSPPGKQIRKTGRKALRLQIL